MRALVTTKIFSFFSDYPNPQKARRRPSPDTFYEIGWNNAEEVCNGNCQCLLPLLLNPFKRAVPSMLDAGKVRRLFECRKAERA